MELVDTHCHIQSIDTSYGERTTRELWAKAGDLTAEQVLSNARTDGVTRMVCVGCDLKDSKLAVNFVQDKENCWASIGIHPHEAQHYAGNKALLNEFAALVSRPKVVAIGECGLDFYYNHSPRAQQEELLKFQLELAIKHSLPVIFHVRDAFDEFWPIFDSYSGIRGVVHSFSAKTAVLEKILQRGLYVGLNGIMTFSKSSEQLEAAKAIPADKLLLETDAPFLTPTPYRGSINEPKQTRVVADFVAQLRGESLEQLAAATTRNARTLFGI